VHTTFEDVSPTSNINVRLTTPVVTVATRVLLRTHTCTQMCTPGTYVPPTNHSWLGPFLGARPTRMWDGQYCSNPQYRGNPIIMGHTHVCRGKLTPTPASCRDANCWHAGTPSTTSARVGSFPKFFGMITFVIF